MYKGKSSKKSVPTDFSLASSVLGYKSQRFIEIAFPVYVNSPNGSFVNNPPGVSTSFPYYYSFSTAGSQTTLNLCNLLAPSALYNIPGTSREFVDMSKIYSHCRIKSVNLDFVRTYVSLGGTSVTNLPPLACLVSPSQVTGLAGDSSDLFLIYYNDNCYYVQPVNTEKHLSGKTYHFPSRSIYDDQNNSYNDWVPCQHLQDSKYILAIGLNLYGCGTDNSGSDSYEIGQIKVVLDLEFSGTQVSNF